MRQYANEFDSWYASYSLWFHLFAFHHALLASYCLINSIPEHNKHNLGQSMQISNWLVGPGHLVWQPNVNQVDNYVFIEIWASYRLPEATKKQEVPG